MMLCIPAFIRCITNALLFLFPLSLLSQTFRLVDSSGGLRWSSVSDAMSQHVSMFLRQGDTIFAVHGGLGAVFSTDDGQSWQRSGMTLPIQVLATNGSRLYTVANEIPHYSNNAGASWIPAGYVDSALGSYQRIVMAANGENAVILCTYRDFTPQQNYFSRLYVTQNGGSIWKKRQGELKGYSSIVFLGNILFATGTSDTTNISYSLDVGKTWLPLPRLPDNITSLYAHRTKLYATTAPNPMSSQPGSRSVYISADSGKTWRQCAEPPDIAFLVPFPNPTPEQRGNSDLPFNISQGRTPITTISASDNGDIIIGLGNSLIYRSTDDGRSWKLINSYLWKGRAYLAQTVFATNRSLIIGGRGIFRCSLEGENLETVCAADFYDRYWFSSCKSQYYSLTTIGSRKKIYFLTGRAGLFRSFDGWIWQPVLPKMFRWKANDPIDPYEFVHPIQSKAYFTSLDGDYCVNALAGDDNGIVAITKSGTVLRSSDRGIAWLPVMQDQRFASENALLLRQESTFLAVINGSAFRSTDYGSTWQEVSALKDIGIRSSGNNAITNITANNTAIFAATTQEILRSLDGGITWSKHTISLDIKEIRSIAAEKSVIYAATDKGIFRSLDNGATWIESEIEDGLKAKSSIIIEIDKNVAVGIADSTQSIFTIDYGKKWHKPTIQSWFYSPTTFIYRTVKRLATNKTSLLALTSDNLLYRTEIPTDLGFTYDIHFPNTDNEFSRVGFGPNPTSDVVKFSWKQTDFAKVSLGIFDTSGKIVGGFVEYEYMPGTYNYIWDASAMATGAYFYRYVIGDRVYSGMIAVKR